MRTSRSSALAAGLLAVLVTDAARPGEGGIAPKLNVKTGKTPAVGGLRLSIHRHRLRMAGNMPYSLLMEGPGVRKPQPFRKGDSVWFTIRNVSGRPVAVPGRHTPVFAYCARDAEGNVYRIGGGPSTGRPSMRTDDEKLGGYVLLRPRQRLHLHSTSIGGLRAGKTYAVWFELWAEASEVVPGTPAWSGRLKSNEITWVGRSKKLYKKRWKLVGGPRVKPEPPPEKPKPKPKPEPEPDKPKPPPEKPVDLDEDF